jgi:hypothetical protein
MSTSVNRLTRHGAGWPITGSQQASVVQRNLTSTYIPRSWAISEKISTVVPLVAVLSASKITLKTIGGNKRVRLLGTVLQSPGQSISHPVRVFFYPIQLFCLRLFFVGRKYRTDAEWQPSDLNGLCHLHYISRLALHRLGLHLIPVPRMSEICWVETKPWHSPDPVTTGV